MELLEKMVQERENILRIFEETKEAIEKNDSFKLKDLSNQTINTASRTQDPDNIATAVVVYSIGKILERRKYREFPDWNKLYKRILLSISNSIISLKDGKDEEFRKHINSLREYIEKLSGNLREYVKDVFRKAQINKASRIYEHGISLERTANLLGITMYELALYSGQANVQGNFGNKMQEVRSRVKTALEIFE